MIQNLQFQFQQFSVSINYRIALPPLTSEFPSGMFCLFARNIICHWFLLVCACKASRSLKYSLFCFSINLSNSGSSLFIFFTDGASGSCLMALQNYIWHLTSRFTHKRMSRRNTHGKAFRTVARSLFDRLSNPGNSSADASQPSSVRICAKQST